MVEVKVVIHPCIKGRVTRECESVVPRGEACEDACLQVHGTVAASHLKIQLQV